MSHRNSRKRSSSRYSEVEPYSKSSKEQYLKQRSMETESFSQLKSQNETLQQELIIIKNQLAHKEAEVQRLNTHLERINMRKLPASEQEKAYEKKSENWKERIKELSVIKDNDKQEINRLTAELDSLKKHWNPMKERATRAETELKNSEEKLKTVREELNNEISQERELVEAWKVKFEQKETEFEQLRTNNRYLARMMEEVEEEKRQAEEENKQLKEEMKGFKEECARVTKIYKLNEERIEWLAGRLERAENMATHPNQQGPTCTRPLCVICRFLFGASGERTPRVLTCGHSICEECAGQIIELAVQQDEMAAAAEAEELGLEVPEPYVPPETLNIKCPTCRHEVEVGPSAKSVPKNFSVIDSINGTF